MQKTSQFKTQCKGDISHAFERAKITVFYPTVCNHQCHHLLVRIGQQKLYVLNYCMHHSWSNTTSHCQPEIVPVHDISVVSLRSCRSMISVLADSSQSQVVGALACQPFSVCMDGRNDSESESFLPSMQEHQLPVTGTSGSIRYQYFCLVNFVNNNMTVSERVKWGRSLASKLDIATVLTH